MKYLIDLGISKEIINGLNDANIYDFKMNEKKISEIILYLKSIGITNLDELIKQETYIFYTDLELIKRAFEIPNKNEIVDSINNDIVAIEEIL